MKAVKMSKGHKKKMKKLYKIQDDFMAKHGLKWNGEHWVRVRDGGRKVGE